MASPFASGTGRGEQSPNCHYNIYAYFDEIIIFPSREEVWCASVRAVLLCACRVRGYERIQ
ncbi:hypothetical protein KGM_206637 [Danaus plexippus plexippus]|uniref:Uncharacterized protein n=1 Tax=Danaus plexippus plexippus TaxID=278856 RepID=A0A212FCB0_DANPL|nr:hypothetical protein KGM_206637 [Danaus plexippus plexippus]